MGVDWLGLWNAFFEFYNAIVYERGTGDYDITVR